ncbi:glycosyltransferase [Hydrogenophilus islandicus]
MSCHDPLYLFVHSRFPCLSETFVAAQAQTLAELGLPVVHLSNRHPRPDEVHPPMRALVDQVTYLDHLPATEWGRAMVWAVRTFGDLFWQTAAALFRSEEEWPKRLAQWAAAVWLLYHFRGRSVHLHAHFTYGAAGVVHWCHALAGVPYSLTLHGSDVLYDNPPDLLAKIRDAAGLVSISQKNFSVLEARFPGAVPAARAVIPLGVEPLPFEPPPPVSLPVRLLNVGRLSEHKAQHVLIDVCALLRERGIPLTCDIIGSGERDPFLRDRIAALGLGEVVHLLGARYHDEILASYRRYHLFVLTSVVEGMPLVVMEAMNAGVPVVTTDVGAIGELVADTAITVPPNDPHAVAAAIERIVRGEIDVAAMAHAAHDRIATHFNMRRNHVRFAEWLRAQPTAAIPV